MGYATYLKELLRPLGIYQWEGGIHSAELDAIGAQFDLLSEELEEMVLLQFVFRLLCALLLRHLKHKEK